MAHVDSNGAISASKPFRVPIKDHSTSGWDGLWEQQITPWDKGAPRPLFVETLTTERNLIGLSTTSDGRRRRAFVPGCGTGYDVLLLASLGYEAYGLDGSPIAVKKAQAYADSHYGEYLQKYEHPDQTPGEYHFICGDFFSDSWVPSEEGFDLVYDYTFLCALPPELRPKWAKRHAELLSHVKASRLICLEFPVARNPSDGGPPFGLSPDVYTAHLGSPGDEIPYTSEGYPEVEHVERGSLSTKSTSLTRLHHFTPDAPEGVSKSPESISIWTHAN